MSLTKERLKVIWMYIDSIQFSKNAIEEMKKKYIIPENIDHLMEQANWKHENKIQEKDEGAVSSLDLSFGEEN